MPAHRPSIDDDVDELHAVPQLDVAHADLAGHLLVGAEQQLLAGLPADVERAADLRPAEAAVVEQPAVLAGERHALGDGLVDDVPRHLGQAVDVALTGAEVAALDGVVEEPIDAVAVAAVVLGRVDAALGGDRVGPAGRVVERERLDLVAELGQRRRRRGAGQTGADDEDLELALVVRVDELRVGDEGLPLLCQRPVRDLGVEDVDDVGRSRVSVMGVLLLGASDRDDPGLDGDRERHVADDDDRGDGRWPGRAARS